MTTPWSPEARQRRGRLVRLQSPVLYGFIRRANAPALWAELADMIRKIQPCPSVSEAVRAAEMAP